MPINLVTGTPGAGKTLYTLSKLVPSLMAPLKADDGSTLERRLVVGGVRDLLLDHDPIDVPRIRDWDTYSKQPPPWLGLERAPGTPALDVPMRADNWHLWCRPGDLIVIDEAQHCFKPMAAGRAVPAFISNLEEHRHYGVDFILVTQHPNLLHANVRALVNPHKHVRRIWGRSATMVYEWDRCSPVTATKTASATTWRHDKKAFGIYKSAELHTKFSQRIPLPAVLAVAAFVALPYLTWRAMDRTLFKDEATPPSAASAPAGTGGPWVEGDQPARPQRVSVPPGKPGFVGVLDEPKTWPLAVAGCWVQAEECACITREESPRIIRNRPALCMAVATGDLQPPPGLPRPERTQPGEPAQAQAPASSPAV